MRSLFAALALLTLAGCTVVGIRSGTEEPPFELVERFDDRTEVRRYGPRLAAETTVPAVPGARNDAFRKLAGYIFGDNRGERRIAMTVPVAVEEGQRIAMTVPVAVDEGTATTTMRFYLPSDLTPATAPLPNDADVRLVEVPASVVAVRRFTGSTGRDAVDRESATLLATLDAAGWDVVGEPVAYFYDPPWSLPPVRRNEVVVAVTPPADRS